MNNKTKVIVVSLILSFYFLAVPADWVLAHDAAWRLNQAVREAKKGSMDFAYMHYRNFIQENPNSRYRPKMLFAQGEYHYLQSDYKQAAEYLNQILNEKESFEPKLFSLMYLLKMAEEKKQTKLAQDLQNKIRSLRNHSFVFRNHKVYKYSSPYYRQLKAVYSIEGIEFYVENRLFTQISY